MGKRCIKKAAVADFSVVDYIAIYTSINKNNWVSVSKIMKFGFIKRENQPIIRPVHSHYVFERHRLQQQQQAKAIGKA